MQHLLYLLLIGLYPYFLLGENKPHLQLLACADRFKGCGRLLYHAAKVEVRKIKPDGIVVKFVEVKKVLCKPRKTVGLKKDYIQVFCLVFIRYRAILHRNRIASDGCEGRTEVMGYVGNEGFLVIDKPLCFFCKVVDRICELLVLVRKLPSCLPFLELSVGIMRRGLYHVADNPCVVYSVDCHDHQENSGKYHTKYIKPVDSFLDIIIEIGIIIYQQDKVIYPARCMHLGNIYGAGFTDQPVHSRSRIEFLPESGINLIYITADIVPSCVGADDPIAVCDHDPDIRIGIKHAKAFHKCLVIHRFPEKRITVSGCGLQFLFNPFAFLFVQPVFHGIVDQKKKDKGHAQKGYQQFFPKLSSKHPCL